MTREEMIFQTKLHWLKYHSKAVKNWKPEDFMKQALAAADLTRMEMDSLMLIGLDEKTAWSEAKTLFCIAPPPRMES